MKNYTFDFYLVKCINVTTREQINFEQILDDIINKRIPTSTNYKGFPRDIYDVNLNNFYSAQVRKLRNTDLPEIGAIGSASTPLHLSQGQGVLERNCFIYSGTNKILVWQNNIHGCTPKIFAELITILSGHKVDLLPILRRESYQRLINNQAIKIKDLDIAVARPSTPDLFETQEPITRQLLTMLNSVGADKLDLKLSTDLRRSDSNGFLSRFSWGAIASILHLEPKKAKITIIDEENDIQYPIDLITDRLRNQKSLNNNNLANIPAIMIIDLAKQAYLEELETINEIIMGIS